MATDRAQPWRAGAGGGAGDGAALRLLLGAGAVLGGPRGVLGGERVPENGVLSGAVIPCLNVFCSKRGGEDEFGTFGGKQKKG